MADIILLGFFATMAVGGWRTGFIRRLVGLAALVAAFILGAYLRGPLGAFVEVIVPDIPAEYAGMMGYLIAFGALTVGINVVAGAMLTQVAVGGMSRATDQALGAAMGLVEAVLIASATIVILHTYSEEVALLAKVAGFGLLHEVATGLDESTVGKLLEATTVPVVLAILGPFLPVDLTKLVPDTIPGLPGLER